MTLLGFILGGIAGILLGFVVCTLMSISKISEIESLLMTKRAKIVELKSQVENRDILIKKQQMEIESYKKELAKADTND